MKIGTVALVIRCDQPNPTPTLSEPALMDCLSEDREIAVFESAIQSGAENPLDLIYAMREQDRREEEEFGNYVETLLSQPFLKREIQEHAIQWLKSKIRIEKYQHAETEATAVIARYAYQLFIKDPTKLDYFLAGPNAKVRIRIFKVQETPVAAAA